MSSLKPATVIDGDSPWLSRILNIWPLSHVFLMYELSSFQMQILSYTYLTMIPMVSVWYQAALAEEMLCSYHTFSGILVTCLQEHDLFRISQKLGHCCCWLFLSCAYHTNWGHHSESDAWNLIMQWRDIEPISLSLENHGWDLRRSWRN